jgi:hypothetical protein
LVTEGVLFMRSHEYLILLEKLDEVLGKRIDDLEERINATDNLIKGTLVSLVLALLTVVMTLAFTVDTKGDIIRDSIETEQSN